MTFQAKLTAGLLGALNLRHPDLTYEAVPVDGDEGNGDTRTAQLRGLEAPLDHGDPIEAASLPDPDHADRAA